jgi:hypothetical protein
LGQDEKDQLKNFAAQGGKLIVAGADALGINATESAVVRIPVDPGKDYNTAMEKDFEHASPDSQQAFFDTLQGSSAVKIKAGVHVATSIARTSDGHINVFLANFDGLVAGSNPVQTPQNGVEVVVKSSSEGKGYFLPFLGDAQSLKGTQHNGAVTFTLPAITKGAVFWYEP